MASCSCEAKSSTKSGERRSPVIEREMKSSMTLASCWQWTGLEDWQDASCLSQTWIASAKAWPFNVGLRVWVGQVEGMEESEEVGASILWMGARWPGTDSLKMISREKWYFPWRSQTHHPILSSLYPTKMASKRHGPPLEQSSGGIVMKHWHPHTQRFKRSGLRQFIISNTVTPDSRATVGAWLRR